MLFTDSSGFGHGPAKKAFPNITVGLYYFMLIFELLYDHQ